MNITYNENEFDENLFEDFHLYLNNSSWKWGYKSLNNMFFRSIPHWSILFGGIRQSNQEYYDCESELAGVIKNIWFALKEKYFQEL